MKQKELANTDIVIYVLYKLSGAIHKIHTEHIAWESFTLAKERFSWRLPEYWKKSLPDKTPVRYALEQAKKDGLVNGRAGGDFSGDAEGWSLTPKGVSWVQENENRISTQLNDKQAEMPKKAAANLVKKIKGDRLYKSYRSGTLKEESPFLFTDMLGCSPDASPVIIKNKFDRLLSSATLLRDKDIVSFLEKSFDYFYKIISSEEAL